MKFYDGNLQNDVSVNTPLPTRNNELQNQAGSILIQVGNINFQTTQLLNAIDTLLAKETTNANILTQAQNINEKLEQVKQGLTATNFNVSLDLNPLAKENTVGSILIQVGNTNTKINTLINAIESGAAKESTASSILIQIGNLNATQISIKDLIDEINETQSLILANIAKSDKDILLNVPDCEIRLVEKDMQHKIFSYSSASLSLNFRQTIYFDDDGDYSGESWAEIEE